MAKAKKVSEFKAGDKFSFSNKKKVRVYTIIAIGQNGQYLHIDYEAFDKSFHEDFLPTNELYYQGKK